MNKYWLEFKSLSLGSKLAFVVLVAVIIGATVIGISKWRDSVHDAKFDAAEAERVKEREVLKQDNDQLRTERDQYIGEAQAAEKRVADLEARAANSQRSLKQARKLTKATNDSLQMENKRYETQITNLSNSNISANERWLRNCTKAIELGIRPASQPCIAAR